MQIRHFELEALYDLQESLRVQFVMTEAELRNPSQMTVGEVEIKKALQPVLAEALQGIGELVEHLEAF